MSLRDLLEQGIMIQGDIDISIYDNGDVVYTTNYEESSGLTESELPSRYLDLEITHIYCENGRLHIDLKDDSD